METDFQKINAICKVCKGQNIKFFAEKNNWKIYKCRQCGLIFVWPLPENLSCLYSADYFNGAKKGFGYVNYDNDKLAMAATFDLYLDKIELFLGSKGQLLDIGAATGYFMEIARKRGWEVWGIEISEHASNLAKKKNLRVLNSALSETSFPHNFFDVITLWDVLEHLPNPEHDIQLINKFLKPGGLIAVNTPDVSSFCAEIMGRRWHALLPPEHLTIFNPQNLSALLGKSGFKVVLVDKIGKKFSLQYIFNILSNWQKFFFWHWLAERLKSNCFGKLAIPINLRDNFFIIARKND